MAEREQFTVKVDELAGLADRLLRKYTGSRVFAFYGELGAGKTTFIKAICEKLGVTEVVNSPTFALINVYKTADDDPVYHFDFYRLEDENEAFDLGYEDYFYSDSYCFLEWPEKIRKLLPGSCVHVKIKTGPDNTRTFEF